MNRRRQTCSQSNSTRWWEFYLVRYALGSVIGAMCVYGVLSSVDDPDLMAKFLMMPSVETNLLDLKRVCTENSGASCLAYSSIYQSLVGFNVAQLILLGIYGLAFNYFSSAPVLVAHAVRREQTLKKCPFRPVIFFIVLPVFVIFSYLMNWVEMTIVTAAIYVVCQLAMIAVEMLSTPSEHLNFYQKLHIGRESGRYSPDSYKHLREHGNAFLIAIQNIAFLVLILTLIPIVNSIENALLLVSIWGLPAALIYFLGHKLEKDLNEL